MDADSSRVASSTRWAKASLRRRVKVEAEPITPSAARDHTGHGREERPRIRRQVPLRRFGDEFEKDLLRDVFDIRTAAEHAGNRACHQRLMLLDELLKCLSITAAHQLHEPHVIGIFFRFILIPLILLRHRDLDVGTRQNLPEK